MENLVQTQLKKLQQRKELLMIFMFLFVIVLFWIGLSIFSSQQKLGITAEQKKLALPLSPNIEVSVVEKLEQKKWYEDWELQSFPVYAVLQSIGVSDTVDITNLPEPSPESTQSAQTTQFVQPTQSPAQTELTEPTQAPVTVTPTVFQNRALQPTQVSQ